jgi:hypothetical protein
MELEKEKKLTPLKLRKDLKQNDLCLKKERRKEQKNKAKKNSPDLSGLFL